MFASYWQKISHGSGYSAFFFALGKAAKAQETQSYQRFQHIGRTAFNTSGTNAATFGSTGFGGSPAFLR